MPNTPAAAARVSDNVKHTEAQEYRFWGAVGTIAAVVVGVAVAAGLGVLEVGSFGLATPLVVAGGVVLAGGMTAVLSGQVADVAADAGRKVMGPDEGPIVTGISSILIGPEKHAAAHLGSWASCKRHKHGGASTMQYAKDIAEDVFGGLIKDVVSLDTGGLLGGGHFNPVADWNQGVKDADKEHNDLEQILQGSSSVFFGRGRYHAARVGDKGTCGFIVGQGCETVIIGGETVTEGEIGTGDDPDKHITDLMKEWGGKAALAGIVLMTLPFGIAALAEVALDIYVFSQVQGVIDDHIKDPEMRHKVDLAITVLTLGYGASKAHGGAAEDGGAAKDSEGAGSGGAEGEPVGESGRGPENGGAESVDAPSGAADPAAPADNAGKGETASEAASSGDPVRQFGESNGGEKGNAPGEQADNTTGKEPSSDKPTEDKPTEDTDPEAEQAAKDKAFRDRSATRIKNVRDNISKRGGFNNGVPRNMAASEFTPVPGSEMTPGAGEYEPSVSGDFSPPYGETDPVTGKKWPNQTEPGTGDLADTTHPLDEPGQHGGSRATDSEIKQMEAFKADLDANPDMRGTQDIYSDPRDPCDSCQDAAEKFNNTYNGRAKVRIHTPDGKVFDKGGGPIDPPDGEGGGQGDPLMQISSRNGGAPGEAPAEQADSGAGAGETGSEAAAGESDPTMQAGDSPGGKTDGEGDSSSSDTAGSNKGTTEAKKWGVTWFNKAALRWLDDPAAVLGPPNGLSWFMPLEDAAGFKSVGDVARETGMAPSVADAYKTGGDVYGLSFPLDGINSRLPVAENAGFNADGTRESWANDNWLDGGHTAVRMGKLGDPNGGYLVNPTHEFVTEGGNPVPPGSVLFKMEPDGSWTPIRRF